MCESKSWGAWSGLLRLRVLGSDILRTAIHPFRTTMPCRSCPSTWFSKNWGLRPKLPFSDSLCGWFSGTKWRQICQFKTATLQKELFEDRKLWFPGATNLLGCAGSELPEKLAWRATGSWLRFQLKLLWNKTDWKNWQRRNKLKARLFPEY